MIQITKTIIKTEGGKILCVSSLNSLVHVIIILDL